VAILSPQSRILFLPQPDAESAALKFTVYALARGGMPDRMPKGLGAWEGYRTLPYDGALDTLPEGWESLAILGHPVDRLIDVWARRANRRAFRRHHETEAIAAARLPENPDLPGFLSRIDAYRAASPAIAAALMPPSHWLGPDLTRITHLFAPADAGAAHDLMVARAGLATAAGRPEVAPPPRLWLDDRTLGLLHDLTADACAASDGRFSFSASLHVRQHRADATRAVPALPRLDRPAAAADPRLAVACILRESPALTRAFVDWYKAAGFGRIFLYFDDPADPMIAALAGDPAVTAVACDAAFWQGCGQERRNAIEARQRVVYADAYARHSSGWIMFCDADEFVWSPQPVARIAAGAPDRQRVIRAITSEPAWGPDDSDEADFSATYLRHPVWGPKWRQLGPQLYGDRAGLFFRGMLGHVAGKYLLRAGLDVADIATHRARFTDGLYSDVHTPAGDVKLQLIHYDAQSYPHWRAKLDRRLVRNHPYAGQSGYRRRQIAAYAERRQDDAAARALFRSLYALDRRQIGLLAHHGLLAQLAAFPSD
jgi:hypothetical protein